MIYHLHFYILLACVPVPNVRPFISYTIPLPKNVQWLQCENVFIFSIIYNMKFEFAMHKNRSIQFRRPFHLYSDDSNRSSSSLFQCFAWLSMKIGVVNVKWKHKYFYIIIFIFIPSLLGGRRPQHITFSYANNYYYYYAAFFQLKLAVKMWWGKKKRIRFGCENRKRTENISLVKRITLAINYFGLTIDAFNCW